MNDQEQHATVTKTQVVEWKSSWRDEYLKWICGFANAQGGVLEIGRNDAGVIVGVANARALLEDLPNKINSTLGILADVDLRTDNGLDYLVIKVRPYPNTISYRGIYYLRSGATNRELTGNALDEFMLRKQGRTWDSVPVPYVKVSDLDPLAFREFRRKALSSERLTRADLNVDDPSLVDRLRLAEGRYLRRAAVLLFGEDPETWVIGAYVKIGKFRTGADLVFQDEVHGPLVSMADKVLDILYAKYFVGLISYEGIQRVETFPVAREALREAVLNAITHRDYSTGVPIQIKVFPDRITIHNTGCLPENWTLAKLLGPHESIPHNPGIASAFFRSGQIEVWGRGIEKIETACFEAGKPAPVFEATSTELRVTFPFGQVSGGESSSPGNNAGVDLGVDGVDLGVDGVDLGVDPGENGVDLGDDPDRVASANIVLAALLAAPTSTQGEIAAATGLSIRTVSRQIARLRDTGVIRRVGSDRRGRWELTQTHT